MSVILSVQALPLLYRAKTHPILKKFSNLNLHVWAGGSAQALSLLYRAKTHPILKKFSNLDLLNLDLDIWAGPLLLPLPCTADYCSESERLKFGCEVFVFIMCWRPIHTVGTILVKYGLVLSSWLYNRVVFVIKQSMALLASESLLCENPKNN